MKLRTKQQQRKINETKNCFFGNINEIDNALASLNKKYRKNYHNRTHR